MILIVENFERGGRGSLKNGKRRLTDNFGVDVALERQRQRQIVERVEADALALANAARHFGLQLAVEQFDDDGAIAQQVIVPRLLRHHRVRPAFAVAQFDVRLVVDAVEIFVQAVEQKSQQLLRVVLLVAVETRRVFSDRPLWQQIKITFNYITFKKMILKFKKMVILPAAEEGQ